MRGLGCLEACSDHRVSWWCPRPLSVRVVTNPPQAVLGTAPSLPVSTLGNSRVTDWLFGGQVEPAGAFFWGQVVLIMTWSLNALQRLVWHLQFAADPTISCGFVLQAASGGRTVHWLQILFNLQPLSELLGADADLENMQQLPPHCA